MSIFSAKEKKNEAAVDVHEFKRENPLCVFTIPARPSVKKQMEYFAATVSNVDHQMLIRYWSGASILILDWKCEILPNHKTDLDEITNPEQTEVLIWAALQVKSYMDALENIPKNS